MRKKAIKAFLVLNIILVLITAMSFMAPGVHPEKNILFAFLGLIFPWIILLNLAFIFMWLVFDKKWALISGLALLLGWVNVSKYVRVNQPIEPSKDFFSVCSFNLKQGYDIRSFVQGESSDKSAEFRKFIIHDLQSDIFCAQEINGFVNDLIESSKIYPYQHRIMGKGVVIYSKFPIVNTGQIDFKTQTNSCLWADIKTPSCIFRVYSYHLQSNNITKDADKVIDKGDIQAPETWTGVRTILGKYKRSTRIRASQTEMIQSHVKNSPHPVILMGDMNEPPQSFVYNHISAGFTDSFLAKGLGFGTTFAGRIPSLRIDYIFVDSNFEIFEHRVIKKKFSDHYPIRAKLVCSNK